jgi:transposase
MQLTIHSPSILICTRSVDFRRGIDGLVNIVQSELNANPQENIFIFYNRSRDKAKILAWHKNGFILLLKRLEKGHFFNIEDDKVTVSVTSQQLSWLLAGLDWVTMSVWGELEYSDFH